MTDQPQPVDFSNWMPDGFPDFQRGVPRKRVDILTASESSLFGPWSDAWISQAMRTDSADWDTFDAAVRECYRLAGLEPPKFVVKCASPLGAALAVGVVQRLLEEKTDEAVDGAIYEAVSGAVSEAVRGAVNGAVNGVVHNAIYGAVSGAVYEAVYGAAYGAIYGVVHRAVHSVVNDVLYRAVNVAVHREVHSAVHSAVYGAVNVAIDVAIYGAVSEAVNGAVSGAAGGSMWLAWQAYESFLHEVCVLDTGKRREAGAYRAAQASAWTWFPRQGFVTVSDRPHTIRTEQIGPRGWGSHQLHCDDGPAIAWRDGFAIFAIHGVVVPRHVVEAPDTITLKEIDSETNAEIRRIMIERYGEGRYLTETGAKLLDADYEGAEFGAAPRALFERLDGQRVLVGTDGSTSRVYYMPVDRRCNTCRDAHESICGFTETLIKLKS